MPPTATRFQAGTLEKVKTKEGACWYIRFCMPAGTKPQRPRFRIGLVKDFPTKKAAREAADDLRRKFNSNPLSVSAPRLFREVIHRYVREEMPARYSTAKGYKNILFRHVEPRWGSVPVTDVRASEVRSWLMSLPLTPKTQGHIRDVMRSLFRFAMLWDWYPIGENPMSLFVLKNSSKRTKKLVVLTADDLQRMLRHPGLAAEPYFTMVNLAAGLGLRCSELFGLQWGDVDWIHGVIRITRSVVDGRPGEVKTDHSLKPLPLHPRLLTLLKAHRSRAIFREDDDWVFASPNTGGEKPYYQQHIQTMRIAPAAKACGLPVGVGWHTFRHTYRAWLGDTGTPVGVQRDLMRHADISTTMNVYGGSYVDSLREANDRVIDLLFAQKSANCPADVQEVEKCQ